MYTWVILVMLSVTSGIVLARTLKHQYAVVLAAAIPWFGLMSFLVYKEYTIQFKAEGLSMWLFTQAFVGAAAALFGVLAFVATRTIYPLLITQENT